MPKKDVSITDFERPDEVPHVKGIRTIPDVANIVFRHEPDLIRLSLQYFHANSLFRVVTPGYALLEDTRDALDLLRPSHVKFEFSGEFLKEF